MICVATFFDKISKCFGELQTSDEDNPPQDIYSTLECEFDSLADTVRPWAPNSDLAKELDKLETEVANIKEAHGALLDKMSQEIDILHGYRIDHHRKLENVSS